MMEWKISRMAFNASIHFGDAITYLAKKRRGGTKVEFLPWSLQPNFIDVKCHLFLVGGHGCVKKA